MRGRLMAPERCLRAEDHSGSRKLAWKIEVKSQIEEVKDLISPGQKHSHSEVVGTPDFDQLFDFSGRQFFGQRPLHEGWDFGVGGETQAN